MNRILKYKRNRFKFNIKKVGLKLNSNMLLFNILFFICISDAILSSMTYSKYETKIESRNSSKVAMFAVEASGNSSTNLSIDCNNSNTMYATYSFNVTNKNNSNISDVTISYDVILKFSSKLLEGTTLTITTENGTETFTGGKDEYIVKNAGKFEAAKEKNNIHTITINGSTNVQSYFDGNMKIFVQAEQID